MKASSIHAEASRVMKLKPVKGKVEAIVAEFGDELEEIAYCLSSRVPPVMRRRSDQSTSVQVTVKMAV